MEQLALVIAGALCLGGGVIIGAYLLRPPSHKARRKRPRKRPEQGSSARTEPAVAAGLPTGAMVMSLDEFVGQPAFPSGTQRPQPPAPPPEPEPFRYPELNEAGVRVVALQQRALNAWRAGEHESAQYWLEQANSIPTLNPFLDEELYGEMRNLFLAMGRNDAAVQCSQMLARLREYLDETPPSNYFQERLEDQSWRAGQKSADIERAELAYLQLHLSASAIREYEIDKALEHARCAVEESVKSVGEDHWITAVMLNNLAEIHLQQEEFAAAARLLRRAKVILSDWNYMVPNLRASINQALAFCDKMGEGEGWKG